MSRASAAPPVPPARPVVAHLALLGVLTIAAFANTLGHPFVWDDNVYVVTNPHLRSVTYLPEYFTASFCKGAAKECAFYRPVVAITYLVDYMLWGGWAFGYHLSTVAVHLAVVLALYVVATSLSGNPRVALVAALFFALHPLRTESVAFVAARTDSPATLLVLLTLWTFARWLRSRASAHLYVVALGAYGLALLTKEISLTVPVLLLLYDLLFVRPWRGLGEIAARSREYLPFALVAIGYLLARRAALGHVTTDDLDLAQLWWRALSAPALVWDYFRLAVVPAPLMIFHGRPTLLGSQDLAAAWGWIFLVAYLVALWRGRRWTPGIPFGGLWFVIVLAPVLNLVPIPWPTVVERFSYLPSVGLALAVGYVADHLYAAAPAPRRRALAAAGAGLLALLAALTVGRNRVWRDDVTLWEDTVRKSPAFPLGHMNLGIAYQERGDLARATEAYQAALRLTPTSAKLHHNLATLYQETGRHDEALAEYRKLIELGEETPQAYLNMGRAYGEKGETAQAIAHYREALARNPDYFNARMHLGSALADSGDVAGAEHEFREAVRIDPKSPWPWYSLGRVLDDRARLADAAEAYARFLALAPPDARTSEDYLAAQARLQALRDPVAERPEPER